MPYEELKEVIKGFLLGNKSKLEVTVAFALWQLKANGEIAPLPLNLVEAKR